MQRVDDSAPGARRRAAMRFALGRPGSFRRWLVGSVVVTAVAAIVVAVTGNPVILIVAGILIGGMFVWRGNLVGDEDELKAGFAAQVVDSIRNPTRLDPDENHTDPAEWFNARPNTFHDVPLPPICEPFDEAPQTPGEVDFVSGFENRKAD